MTISPWIWFALYYAVGVGLFFVMVWVIECVGADDIEAHVMADRLRNLRPAEIVEITLLTALWPLVIGEVLYKAVRALSSNRRAA